MAVTVTNYKDFQLSAGAFQVPSVEGFLSWIHIVRSGASMDERNGRLFTPRSDWGNALFGTEEEAVDAAIVFGKKLIDGELAGLTLKDL